MSFPGDWQERQTPDSDNCRPTVDPVLYFCKVPRCWQQISFLPLGPFFLEGAERVYFSLEHRHHNYTEKVRRVSDPSPSYPPPPPLWLEYIHACLSVSSPGGTEDLFDGHWVPRKDNESPQRAWGPCPCPFPGEWWPHCQRWGEDQSTTCRLMQGDTRGPARGVFCLWFECMSEQGLGSFCCSRIGFLNLVVWSLCPPSLKASIRSLPSKASKSSQWKTRMACSSYHNW